MSERYVLTCDVCSRDMQGVPEGAARVRVWVGSARTPRSEHGQQLDVCPECWAPPAERLMLKLRADVAAQLADVKASHKGYGL